MTPPESLRAFPLSLRAARYGRGRSQRTQAIRRLRGLAALARLPWLGPRQFHARGLT